MHRAGLSPRRRASTIATRAGAPLASAVRLAGAIKAVLIDAIERGGLYAASGGPRFRVYEREGERCLKKECRVHQADYADGPVDVLLSHLPEVTCARIRLLQRDHGIDAGCASRRNHNGGERGNHEDHGHADEGGWVRRTDANSVLASTLVAPAAPARPSASPSTTGHIPCQTIKRTTS